MTPARDESADVVEYEDGAVKVTSGENGAQVTLGGAGTAMPDGWPAAFPLYPGAKVTLSYLRTEDGGSRVVMLSSPEPAERLIEFYSAKAVAEGFVEAADKRSPGNWARDYVTQTRAFNIAAQDSASGVDLSLQLMEGRDNSLPSAPEVYWQGVDALPPGWPAGLAPRLPGATIEAVACMPEGERFKYRMQMTSAKRAEEAQAFYRDVAAANGLTPVDAAGAALAFEGPAGHLEFSAFESSPGNKYLVTLYASVRSPGG